MTPDVVVIRFNDAINARDLGALEALMTADHVFIDVVGGRTEGQEACLEAWRSFFAAFPDYRNRFERVDVIEEGVIVRGRSDCSVAELDGPALWRAAVAGGRVREWQVYDDTPANRDLLGMTSSG